MARDAPKRLTGDAARGVSTETRDQLLLSVAAFFLGRCLVLPRRNSVAAERTATTGRAKAISHTAADYMHLQYLRRCARAAGRGTPHPSPPCRTRSPDLHVHCKLHHLVTFNESVDVKEISHRQSRAEQLCGQSRRRTAARKAPAGPSAATHGPLHCLRRLPHPQRRPVGRVRKGTPRLHAPRACCSRWHLSNIQVGALPNRVNSLI